MMAAGMVEPDALDRVLAALPDDSRAAVRDAVERRVAQRLAASARRLLLAQESGGIGTYEICLTHGVTTGSPRFFQLLGLPGDTGTLARDDWWAVIHPDDHAWLGEILRRNLRNVATENVAEYRVLVAGVIRWIRSCDRVERDASGRAIAAYGVIQDITDRKLAEERVWRAAHHDALTGLPNRLLFGEQLTAALDAAGHASGSVGLVMIDLDRLKATNDRFGHGAGDHLLRAAGERLAVLAPANGLAARLGGDEFALIAPGLDAEGLAAFAAAAIARLRAPLRYEGEPLDCGASAGAALFPVNAVSPDGLLRAADVALCVAKLTARGRCLDYQPGLDAELTRRTRRRTRLLALAA